MRLKPRLHDTTCCQTGLTNGCIVYTNIQPVVNRFDSQFDNRLYRVNGVLETEIILVPRDYINRHTHATFLKKIKIENVKQRTANKKKQTELGDFLRHSLYPS